ncbi:Glycosyltransferase KanE [Legionella massiliensis]|uniref:Glycosyltransferase KanE n=1 Tax=Legionella massiliensis TaxID=1034943 RepID=A0A078KWU7_9GAMM|nr:glycosyltransferase family 1 protein [Legionella massiliensis]CDZ76244.1 Glycosyltransferase KanE [Legionella massiliensis]CEE11982.1 Alpha-D-kanosaminyltransferase [Legionella massiliensis]
MAERIETVAVDLTPVLPGGENGGAKIFVLELLKQLAQLAPKTSFILLTQEKSHSELKAMESENIKCIMVLGNSVKSLPLFNKLMSSLQKLPYIGRKLGRLGYRLYTMLKRKQAHSVLKEIKADLLFCPFTAPTYFEAGVPTVCTIYDLQYKTYPEFFSQEEIIHRHQTFIDACRNSSMLTAISEYSRQSAIKYGELNPEKIRTIYLQMAQRILPNEGQDQTILDRLGLTSEQYLLYPANFWKHKNHEMLLTAFGIASKDKLPANIKLVCTGAEGLRHSWLQNAAASMNLSDRIIFPGFLTNNELAVLMSHSSAVVFPSLYEGFGLPVIEAMASGTPVACSNLTSLPEIAADAALLFNPRIPTQIAEALVTLTTDKALREKLIVTGKERAKLFSDSKLMAQEYWELFQTAIREKSQDTQLAGDVALNETTTSQLN